MRDNYAPWAIEIEDFPEKGNPYDQLKFLLGFAILAPSGHNSQPWEFRISDNSIDVFVNPDRSLAKSDPERRQLLIGIGCAIENLEISADYFGYLSNVNYFPTVSDQNHIASIYFKKTGSIENNPRHLIYSIPKRATNRNPYKADALPPEFITTVGSLKNQFCGILIVDSSNKKNLIADITNTAQIEIMDESYFREELSKYVKSNYTRSKIGMPGFTQGIPGPISFLAPKLIKKINFARKNAKKDSELLREQTPAFVIVSSRDDNDITKVKSGETLENVWLIAESFGLKVSPLAAPTQVGNYWKEIQKILGLDSRPQILARVGYCDKQARHTPRLPAEEVIIK